MDKFIEKLIAQQEGQIFQIDRDANPEVEEEQIKFQEEVSSNVLITLKLQHDLQHSFTILKTKIEDVDPF